MVRPRANHNLNVDFFSFFFCCTTLHATWIFPNEGSILYPLRWKHGVLTTGPPRKSYVWIFDSAECQPHPSPHLRVSCTVVSTWEGSSKCSYGSLPPCQMAWAVLGWGRQVYWGRVHKPLDIRGQKHKRRGAPPRHKWPSLMWVMEKDFPWREAWVGRTFKLDRDGLHVAVQFVDTTTYPGSFLRLIYIQSHLHYSHWVPLGIQGFIYLFIHSV